MKYEGLRWLHLRSKYNRATTLCTSKKLSAQHPAKPRDTKHLDRPWETSGRQVSLLGAKSRHVGDKCEIMRPEHSEHPELTRRQVGDKWETSVKSCGQALRASRAYWETSGRQVGDKWETSIKSCGQRTQSIQSLLGDKWETNGTQV